MEILLGDNELWLESHDVGTGARDYAVYNHFQTGILSALHAR